MLDYVISNFYPEITGSDLVERTQKMFEILIDRTAKMVAHWQAIGFCHGVLNTDNLSIVGLTIDYGPYGFMEHFDKNHICNHSDNEGRYKYAAQPSICAWNLEILRKSIKNYLKADYDSKQLLDKYNELHQNYFYEMMKQKLGLKMADSALF